MQTDICNNSISASELGIQSESSSDILYLPPAFNIVPRLLSLLEQEDADGDDLVDLIRLDAGLTANVLRVANSAAYAGTYLMDTLGAAVLRLGLRELYRIVLQVVASPVFENVKRPGAPTIDLWEHSVQTAIAAQIIAHRCGEDPEVAFTSALLHDLGKVVFLQHFQQHYVILTNEALRQKDLLYKREFSRFGADHASVGGRLLKSWNFPEKIVHCIAFHHEPVRSPKEDLRCVCIVHAANLLSHRLGGSGNPASTVLAPQPRVLRELGFETAKELWEFESEVQGAFTQESARVC